MMLFTHYTKRFFISYNLCSFSTSTNYIKKQLLVEYSIATTKKTFKNKIPNEVYFNKSTPTKSLSLLSSSGLGISIRMSSNNIFSTLWSIRTGKTLYITSSGLNKIAFSKKKLFYVVKKNLEAFFKKSNDAVL